MAVDHVIAIALHVPRFLIKALQNVPPRRPGGIGKAMCFTYVKAIAFARGFAPFKVAYNRFQGSIYTVEKYSNAFQNIRYVQAIRMGK